jgi:serine/threonine protein kinase
MELIHGQTLLDYCDQHRLSSRQRLEVMAKICDAVQHAHQRGLIHRNLKPCVLSLMRNRCHVAAPLPGRLIASGGHVGRKSLQYGYRRTALTNAQTLT